MGNVNGFPGAKGNLLALRAFVSELFLKSFYEKNTINILTVFSIFHKSDIKTFIKRFVNNCTKSTH